MAKERSGVKKKQKEPRPPTASDPIPSSKAVTSSTVRPLKSIRIERPFLLPSYVKTALHQLNEAGHVAYLVGGSVRDFLLGKDTKDHDIATSANPDELCRLFPRAVTVGKAFGVIKVPTGTEPPLLEIATFRTDVGYQDHRHPTQVLFTGPEEDARRRDFTMNALYFDPKTSMILDFTGGLKDLNAKLIRAIGNPSERFREDALRLLRAIRFKTRLGFELDPETAAAITARSRLVTKVSSERIRDELTLIWTGPHPAEGLKLLSETGLLKWVLPEVEALKGMPQIPAFHPKDDIWTHLLRTLEQLEKSGTRTPTLAWAAVLHEVGKPVVFRLNGGQNYNNHEIEGSGLAAKIAGRMRMSRMECDRIKALVADHLKFKDVFKMRDSTLQRFLMEEHFEELLALHEADAIASDGNLAFFEFCATQFQANRKSAGSVPEKFLDGNDLIQLGLKPGPEFTEILRAVEDLALEKKIKSKDEALEYILKTYVK